jgi:hypothetical protein
MLSQSYIERLDEAPERKAALLYLGRCADKHRYSAFVPAYEAPKGPDKPKRFAALWLHANDGIGAMEGAYSEVGFCNGQVNVRDFPPDDMAAAAWLAQYVFTRQQAGSLVVCDGVGFESFDVLLTAIGPHLLGLGYAVEPCAGAEGIGWIRVRKGKRTWTVTSVVMMTGCHRDILHGYAEDARAFAGTPLDPPARLFDAIDAYSSLIAFRFGTALRPTIGMIASACARRSLPSGVVKWRTNPLLIAFEREGIGYRGGVVFGSRFRGAMHRIDVNRQYTALLRMPLPLEATFTRHGGSADDRPGVYLCTIEAPTPFPYPIGEYDAGGGRFRYSSIGRGRIVSVLHTSEWPGLYAQGVRIEAGYGFAFNRTFTLARHADSLESYTTKWGRNSFAGKLTKPLGNMVYGKFGQKPERWQLLYCEGTPDKSWYPYMSDEGEDVPGVWERQVVRHSAGMHVEIAAHITGAARSQLMQTIALLEQHGYHVVRAHTDSITTNNNPQTVLPCDSEIFGAWKYDSFYDDGIVVGGNAYADDHNSHVAGVTDVSRRIIDELYATGRVTVTQTQRKSKRGWSRGKETIRKELRA